MLGNRVWATFTFFMLLELLSCSFDRQLVFNHRQSLADELRQESDAAMTLHLASVLLVHVHTQCMVHAPGRCVPQIVAFLQQYLPADQYSILLRSQGYCCNLFTHILQVLFDSHYAGQPALVDIPGMKRKILME